MKVVICTGGFDPLTNAHVAYFESARALGDRLIVGVNSDEWLERKKGKAFMSRSVRRDIIKGLRAVDDVIYFNDDDGSAIDAIERVRAAYPDDEIIFANGGDRTKTNIPEMVCKDVTFVFGVGGENKLNSSSWLLAEWEDYIRQNMKPVTNRVWGCYQVLDEINSGLKVKLLKVDPGKSLSYQRHFLRKEFWVAVEGQSTVNRGGELLTLNPGDTIMIGKEQWHQLINKTDKVITVFEVQFGDACYEEDIERA